VQRLHGALAEKTVEAQNLQHELQTALQVIEKHQSSQQRQENSEAAAEVDTPASKKSPETSTAVSSQD